MITLAMRMKMTNLGLPSSSILGRGGGAERWNWRDIIPFLPLASTTNTWRGGAFKLRCCLRWETRECLTETSSLWRKREFVGGRRRRAFRDIPTSIDAEKVNQWVSFTYLLIFLLIFYFSINNCEEQRPYTWRMERRTPSNITKNVKKLSSLNIILLSCWMINNSSII